MDLATQTPRVAQHIYLAGRHEQLDGRNCPSKQPFSGCSVEVIPIGLDLETWRPVPKAAARDALGLPIDQPIVLLVAINPFRKRKGFELFATMCRVLRQRTVSKEPFAVIVGADTPSENLDLGLPTRYFGRLNDDISLALAYSAADVTVVPSLQEAFGKTALESLACATPVVCFDTGGLRDIVDHRETGFKSSPGNAESLAEGVQWILENQAQRERAREAAEDRFSLRRQAETYIRLYQRLAR